MYKTTLKIKHSRFPSDFVRHSTKYDWVDILIQLNESKILQIHMIIFQWWKTTGVFRYYQLVSSFTSWLFLSPHEFIHQIVIILMSLFINLLLSPHECIHQLIMSSRVHSPTCYYQLMSSFTDLLSVHEYIHQLVFITSSSFINLLLSLMSSFTNRPMAV